MGGEHNVHKYGLLDSAQTAARFRTALVLALEYEVFGSEEKALKWLRRQRGRFSGQAAVELVKTGPGANLVEEALLQIDSRYFG